MQANARRIVACVNACAGMTNEQLDNVCMISGSLINRFGEQMAYLGQVEKERDELLAALEYCRAVFDEYIGIHLDKTPPDYDKAARNENHRAACDAAIASAKGGAA